MLEHVNENNFEQFLKNNKTVLIDFSATWCGPCKMFSPILEKYAADHPEIKIAKVDVDESPNLAGKFRVRGVPTVCVFDNEEMVGTRSGLMSYAQLDSYLNNLI